MTQPYSGIIDGKLGTPWFTATGGFSSDGVGARGNQYEAAAGTGTSSATYAFTGVPASTYKVYLTWQNPFGGGATNAPASVYDDATLRGTSAVDMGVDPTDLTTGVASWKLLGTYAVSSGTLRVVLTDDANGTVYADAVFAVDSSVDPTSPVQPAFADAVADDHLYPSWYPTVPWTYDAGGNHLIVLRGGRVINESYEFGPDWVEVVARVRVDSWVGGTDSSSVGVSLCSPGVTAYNMLFYGGYDNTTVGGVAFTDHDCVHFLDDAVAHGDAFHFPWSENTWYWFHFRRDGTNLYGNVWADGGTEPSSWLFSQALSDHGFSDRGGGYPGLYGGGNTTDFQASFSDFSVNGPPVNAGSASVTPSHPTLSGHGTFAAPAYRGSLAAAATHPTLSGSGSFAPPRYHGQSPAAASHPTLSGSGRYVGQSPPPLSITGSADPAYAAIAALFTSGVPAENTASVPLAVANTTTPAASTLFVRGDTTTNWLLGGGVTLSAAGGSPATLSASLFVKAPEPASNRATLFVKGPLPTHEGVNLAVATDPAPTAGGTSTLFLAADTNGARGLVTCVVAGVDAGNTGSMNLYASGHDGGSTSELMNMSLLGGYPAASRGLTLFAADTPPAGDYVTLAVQGQGVNPGFFPADEPMNLTVLRGPEAGVTLVLNNLGVGLPAPLFVAGCGASDPNPLPLYACGDGGTPSGVADLFASGKGPDTASLAAPLSVADVIGWAAGTSGLFASGWAPYGTPPPHFPAASAVISAGFPGGRFITQGFRS